MIYSDLFCYKCWLLVRPDLEALATATPTFIAAL